MICAASQVLPAPYTLARGPRALAGEQVWLPTIHGKGSIIAPLLRHSLGVSLRIDENVDTDQFGTFSHDVPREGSALDAARRKIDAVFEKNNTADWVLASEGSFGPHPAIALLPLARELVVLKHRATELEIIGRDTSLSTNFAHKIVQDVAKGLAFAKAAGFPRHGLIVLGVEEGEPAPNLFLEKGLDCEDGLATALEAAIASHGSAFIETDMRAHMNPTRRRAIGRATKDLVRRLLSRCTACGAPGFGRSGMVKGRPCSLCGGATDLPRAIIESCVMCDAQEECPVPEKEADPQFCPYCNP